MASDVLQTCMTLSLQRAQSPEQKAHMHILKRQPPEHFIKGRATGEQTLQCLADLVCNIVLRLVRLNLDHLVLVIVDDLQHKQKAIQYQTPRKLPALKMQPLLLPLSFIVIQKTPICAEMTHLCSAHLLK